ncbi:MvdC/MvdD family ATP grasp protein, partial [Nonomuraea sp. NPDC049480]|uniref:MvdC/MvdD family ATP grasp protein n=1 Tax=Nonomuraea sp. NPDC049480 TaxID=3364353 RepID=UPI0037B0CF98
MLLIISAALDDSVGLVMPKLKARGVPVLWWDEADFPEHTLINVELLEGNCHQTLTYRGVCYDLAEITAVWHRRPGPPSASSVTHPTHRVYAQEAARRVLDGVYDLMPADRWMPARPKDMVRVDDKLLHLRRAV